MITTEGKTYIKRYLAGQVPSIGQCIAFGAGAKAEAVGDTALQFEVDRADVILTSYDFVADKVVFKAILNEFVAGTIYEVALYSQAENPVAGQYASKPISTFDSETETWTDLTSGLTATFATTSVRIGADGLSHTPALSTSTTSVMSDLVLDLSGYSSADVFNLAYNVSNANTASVVVRFMTDSANYFSFTRTAPGAGYRVDTVTKGSLVATGTPSWDNITSVQVTTTANATGAAGVTFDGLRIEDADTVNPEYVMVARELLSSSFTKQEGKVQEIEFALSVSIT